MQLTTHLHAVPRLRMSGVIPLLPLYDFMACTGTHLLVVYNPLYTNDVYSLCTTSSIDFKIVDIVKCE